MRIEPLNFYAGNQRILTFITLHGILRPLPAGVVQW